jgi:uncharacterized protein (DUF924 family)
MNPETVLNFWFKEIEPKSWWKKDPDFDQLLRDKFLSTHHEAASCELYTWRDTARGRLAEIIVLDQFSLNMFRGSPVSFMQDSLALALAQEAVRNGADKELETNKRLFMYMPYMHSESAAIHEIAVELLSTPGLESNLEFEYKHKAIIDRFGRYPHRNAILRRTSTAEELQFLTEPGSSF